MSIYIAIHSNIYGLHTKARDLVIKSNTVLFQVDVGWVHWVGVRVCAKLTKYLLCGWVGGL